MTAAERSSAPLEHREIRPARAETRPLERAAAGMRLLAIDHAKAIGITLVVFGHVWRGMVAAGIVRPDQGYGWIDTWVYAFHMPLFFFLAGLFIERSVSRPMGNVLAHKAATLLYPYLIWLVAQAVLGSFLTGYTNRQFDISELPRVILLHPYSPFWFLYVLFLAEMLFIAARKIAVPQAVLFVAGLSLLWWADGFRWVPGMYFGNMFVYFVAGALLSSAVLRLSAKPTVLAFYVGVLAGIVLTVLTLGADVHKPLVEFLAAICGILMVLGLATALSRFSWTTALAGLGILSLQVYLMHILFTSGARVLLHRFAHVDSPWIHLPTGLAFGIAGPVLFWMVTRPIGGQWLFGLPTRSSSAKRSVVS